MIGLMMLAEPIISVLYQHGKFTAFEAGQAAGALRFYAIGLPGYAALKVLVNAFYALERRKTPMLVSLAAVGVNLGLNWVFTFHLGWGVRGLAFSTGCVATFNFLLLYMLMRGQLHGLDSRRMIRSLLKVALACVPLAAVCAAANAWLLRDWATQAFLVKGAALGVAVVAGVAAFAASGLALRIEELGAVAAAVRRRIGR
jgi:putative peptidoglycan lipid II flippase